jgi:hypothetical protein
MGWTEWPDRALERAHDHAQTSIRGDPWNQLAHIVLAIVYTYRQNYELALQELDRALEAVIAVEVGAAGLAPVRTGASARASERDCNDERGCPIPNPRRAWLRWRGSSHLRPSPCNLARDAR